MSLPARVAVPIGVQNWLREPFFGEGKRAEVLAPGDRFAHVSRAQRFDDAHGGVVHERDHGGRTTGAGQALDHGRCGAEVFALTADVLRAQQPEQAGLAERSNAGAREAAGLINFLCRWRDHIADDAV